jgi:hypothetical protein
MPNATASRVRTYLDELDRALSHLPKDRRTEIVRDIRSHIDVALAERGEPSAADVEQVLEELGTPQEIAEAAYAELPPPRARIAGRDIATVILLLVGGFVFLIGWVVGAVLLWTSTAWRTKDKVIGTLLFPGGLLAPILLLLVGGLMVARTSGGPCSTVQQAGSAAVTHCASSGGGWIGPAVAITLLVVSFVGPIFSAVWLIRTARRVS